MWSRGVKIQIENHLANLPVIRSVNKFRFTRVGGLRYGSARETKDARRATRCFNLHKSDRVYTLVERESPRNISRYRNGSFYRSIERKLACGIYGHAICWTEGNVCANVNKDAIEREMKIQSKDRRVLLHQCYVIHILLANRCSGR